MRGSGGLGVMGPETVNGREALRTLGFLEEELELERF